MSDKSKALTLLSGLFAVQMTLDPYGEHMDFGELLDKGFEYNPKAEDVKFYMNMEIIKLLQEGFSEDEVLEMIDELSVDGMNKLSEKYQNYVKNETKKLLIKRKERLYYE